MWRSAGTPVAAPASASSTPKGSTQGFTFPLAGKV
jgi:hypothetical protein